MRSMSQQLSSHWSNGAYGNQFSIEWMQSGVCAAVRAGEETQWPSELPCHASTNPTENTTRWVTTKLVQPCVKNYSLINDVNHYLFPSNKKKKPLTWCVARNRNYDQFNLCKCSSVSSKGISWFCHHRMQYINSLIFHPWLILYSTWDYPLLSLMHHLAPSLPLIISSPHLPSSLLTFLTTVCPVVLPVCGWKPHGRTRPGRH